jgi:hypothetical protein
MAHEVEQSPPIGKLLHEARLDGVNVVAVGIPGARSVALVGNETAAKHWRPKLVREVLPYFDRRR